MACSLFSGVLNQRNPDGAWSPGYEDEGDTENGEDSGDRPESGQFSSLTKGLEALNSYRASFFITVDGTDQQGNPSSGLLEMLEEQNRGRKQAHTRYNFEGAFATESTAGNVGIFETYEMNDTAYIISETGANPGCTSLPILDAGQFPSAIISPADLVSGIQNPRLEERGETVDGIIVDRYSFREAGFYFGSVENIEGEYWLAVDEGYVVRLVAKAEGKGGLFGTAIEGQYSVEYDVRDVNSDFEISLPGVCETQQQAEDIPIPSSAAEKNAISNGIIQFSSSQSAAEIADFYRSEMPANGWAAGEETSSGGLTLLEFTKESRSASITITQDGNGLTSVLISVSE